MATLKEIASQAGVTVTTVSRVLTGSYKATRGDAVERADRIRRLARELCYRPHGSARAMKRGKFGCVTLLLSTNIGRSALPPLLLAGLHAALAENDLDLLVTRVPDGRLAKRGHLPRFLREHNCDGLLINYTDHIPGELVRRIEEDNIPSVWLNTRRPHDCVFPDDVHGGRLATEALIRAGHRAIAYLDYSHGRTMGEPHYSSTDREAGYRQAVEAAGLSSAVIRPAGPTLVGSRRADEAQRWLARPNRPTAVVGYSRGVGIPIAVAAARLGIDVPDELAIASIDDHPEELAGHRFMTAVVPQFNMGCAAVDMLVKKIAHPTRNLAPRPVPFFMAPDTSCV